MLKRLEIAGFKSFARKTVLDFSSSVTSVVGPNGSGKCVTGDTEVQLSSGARVPIKELFERAEQTARVVRQYDDGVAILESDAPQEVLAVDPKTQRVRPRKVEAFVKRTSPETLLIITTRSGRHLTTTPYHPLFVLNDGVMEAARADELMPGIRIASPRRLPVSGKLQTLSMRSVLSAFKEEDAVYIPYAKTLVARLRQRAGTRSATRVGRQAGIRPETIQRFWDGQALPASAALTLFAGEDGEQIFSSRELKSRTWGFVRVPEAVDEKVARFLGYLIAEGRNCKNGQIRFVNDDAPLVEDFVACAMECFGVSTTLRSYKGRGIIDAFISSMVLSRLLDRVFGISQDGHSRTKTVPRQIYGSPDTVVAAFLAALFEGDGHIHLPKPGGKGPYFEYTSASQQLAEGVAALLLRMGIHAIVRRKEKRATNGSGIFRAYWSVFIYGAEQLSLLSRTVSFRGRKGVALAQLRTVTAPGNPNLDLIPGAALLVRHAVRAAGVRVKSARKEYPTLAAYTEQRCEASRPGIARCIEAIEKYGVSTEESIDRIRTLRTLIEADVLWDEIVSVTKTPGTGFVYDLCVAEDHNFIANGVVAHNSNVAEAFRFALGEQSMKSMRGKRSEDLIWSGSNMAPRANRAAVTIVFDNTKKIFPKLEFDEVSIERAVFRDGASEYAINGSRVRLRDVHELLASANIGETGHHIISQGEADRILTAAPRERRSMLEDALGLKVFEFKKQEAERKLEKTEDNVGQVEALRREIAPHIRFLGKQVERLERAEELASELRAACQTYFAIEEAYIRFERERTETRLRTVSEHLMVLETELAAFEERVTTDTEGMKRSEAVRKAERELDRLTSERSGLAREIGRIEGALNEAKRRSVAVARDPYVKVPRDDMKMLRDEVEKQVLEVEGAEPGAMHAALQTLRATIKAFFERYGTGNDDILLEEEQASHSLEAKRTDVMEKDRVLSESIDDARTMLSKAREATMAHEETGREQNRRLLELAEEKATTESERSRLSAKMGELDYLAEDMEQGKREAIALVGVNALSYEPVSVLPNEERRVQEDRKRSMERLKIRVEEAGGSGEDVRSEFKEASERETFLASELEDLAKSAASLKELIADLDQELQKSFAEGLQKVNSSFGEFFGLMFGGGGARLVLEEIAAPGSEDEEDEEYEEDLPKKKANQKPGIEIAVNLPKKRVQALMQLSGGERALTSIALIFAMSQVNPPPFLILDETDAALDEANSRRYGDMIHSLSSKSQLIVITHNRETMSRASILYGVTMGGDGISKLLSVKFDEAIAVAK